jgi:hypothetical protein
VLQVRQKGLTATKEGLDATYQLSSSSAFVWIDYELINALQVIGKEGLTATKDGLEAIIFTADGDMRQALNNLQVRWLRRCGGCTQTACYGFRSMWWLYADCMLRF